MKSRSEENFIRNTSILGPRLEYVFRIVEYGLKLQFDTEYGPFGGHLEYVEYVFTE